VKASILIVDDEFGLAELVADILTDHGYEATLAINGRQGLARLTERPVDLVVVDVMMPVMSGPELVARMRATRELADIPVVVMTTSPRELGGTHPYQGVLQKPFSSEALVRTVAAALEKNATDVGSRL